MTFRSDRLRTLAIVATLLLLPMPALASRGPRGTAPGAAARGSRPRRAPAMVRLPGHVLPALGGAEALPAAVPGDDGVAKPAEPLTVTLVLKRDHQAAFEAYLRDLYDPASPHYRRFLTQQEIADRFGPSREVHDRVLRYLRAHGFTLVRDSVNRLTLTVRGTRAAAEDAFAVQLGEYRLGARTFRAIATDPALPKTLAPHVEAVLGLSTFAEPHKSIDKNYKQAKKNYDDCIKKSTIAGAVVDSPLFVAIQCSIKFLGDLFKLLDANGPGSNADPAPGDWVLLDGSGQTIGLLEFDGFVQSDVVDYLSFMGIPASHINQLSHVPINGGAPLGATQDEVLLDIDTVLQVAPGANVAVYDAPFTGAHTSFQTLFNAMIDDGVTIISNSWTYCEDQTSTADVQSLETIFQSAAAAGITVFNASGDTGSTCLDGSPNTIGVPAGAPSATAVGGTSATTGPGFTHDTERWWDGTQDTPPTGQSGFGVSRFFSRPSYQNGVNLASNRSIPDVVTIADPANGSVICQASNGGCPTGLIYGGTSGAAPLWAAYAAILNQGHGSNLGALNPLIYPLANTDAFHDAASMGSDFSHVGLGSPNLNLLHLALKNQTVGAVNAATSEVGGIAPSGLPDALTTAFVPADGATKGFVVVKLRDGATNTVAGKSVTLAANVGNHAVIGAPSGPSTIANGAVIFEVTDLTPEVVTFTATDTTDGLALQQTGSLTFIVPSAASAGIQAFPTTVPADGTSTTTITVTLTDALQRPTPGKLITLSQGNSHSVISGPNPSVTDAGGQIQFTASDQVNETVTYTAVDVTDGNLPVPGNAQVTFNNGSGNACGQNVTPPTGLNGYTITPYATGFTSGPLFFGNVNFGGCAGVLGPAFHDDSAFVLDFFNGDVFRLGAAGGAAASANLLGTVGPTLGWPVFSKSGRLYATRVATTGNFTTGAVLELDPDTGAVLRTVVPNAICAQGLVGDPVSGDLFFDDECFGAGSDNPSLFRVRNPDSVSPTVEVYATLPSTPNGQIAISPKGTIYVVSNYNQQNPPVIRVSGTDQPQPPTVTTLTGVVSNYWINVGTVGPDGEATSLITLSDGKLHLVDLTANPPAITATMADGTGGGFIGPDGCLYMPNSNVIYKLTDPNGGCSFLPTSAVPSISLTPATIAPDPAQGDLRTFTATLLNVDAPAGTPVFFRVLGANVQFQQVLADAEGHASFSYTALNVGTDEIVALASIDSDTLTSNPAHVTWTAGKHTTFLTLNPSPRGGHPGEVITVTASLSDMSMQPPVPTDGATVELTLGTDHCTATTDADGFATCQIDVGAAGVKTLTATFAGSATATAASDAVGFTVTGPAVLGHFLGYATAVTKGTPKFAKLGAVQLGDPLFGFDAGYDVVKPMQLAAPADTAGNGFGDPITHLEAYAVKLAKGSPKFQKRVDTSVTNECGTLFLTAGKPTTLLVPSAEDPSRAPAIPNDGDHNVDHFLCFQAKAQKKTSTGTPVATFPKGVQMDVIDHFQTRRYDLKKIVSLCDPVTKDGTPVVLAGPTKGTPVPLTPAVVRNPLSQLVCYSVALAKKRLEQNGCGPANPTDKGTKIVPPQTKSATVPGLFVANQLGSGQVDVKKQAVLCVPSTRSVM